MTPDQRRVCAARLTPLEARAFLDMMDRAAKLRAEAARLRLEAWAFYRECTGLPKRGGARE